MRKMGTLIRQKIGLIVLITDLCPISYFQDQLSLNAGQKHQFAYVCKFEVRSHDIVYSWSIITNKQIYFCMTSRGGANILLPTPVYSRSIHTYVSKCVHMTP